jgi:hypothetical protein
MQQGFRVVLAVLFFSILATAIHAQDTLPRFTVEDKGNGRVIISWSNPYSNLIQLAVQRSYDSLNRFSTVYSSTSPELPVNGYSDKITPGSKVFYRIFYVMKGGSYYFTRSMRAKTAKALEATVVDTRRDQLGDALIKGLTADQSGQLQYPPDKRFYLKMNDTLFATLAAPEMAYFRDSILQYTRDTLYQLTEDTLVLARYMPPFVQRTSEHVFTDKEGFIIIKLPDADKKRYQLLFLEEDETPVLELKSIKEPYLILDKTNFYHGGWYKFELRENNQIKERNKIFLPREF